MNSNNTSSQSSQNEGKSNKACSGNSTDFNRLFTRQQNWEINMQNKGLKERIDATKNKSKCSKPVCANKPKKSSMTVNQEKRNREIEIENERIALRIKNVKSTIKR